MSKRPPETRIEGWAEEALDTCDMEDDVAPLAREREYTLDEIQAAMCRAEEQWDPSDPRSLWDRFCAALEYTSNEEE